jgi:hypothetical protein
MENGHVILNYNSSTYLKKLKEETKMPVRPAAVFVKIFLLLEIANTFQIRPMLSSLSSLSSTCL